MSNNINITPFKSLSPCRAYNENTACGFTGTGGLDVFCDKTQTAQLKNTPTLMPLKTRLQAASTLRVGSTVYTEHELLGTGGYSTVHTVKADGKTFALKRVSLEGHSASVLRDLKREIELLQTLKGCSRVVQLHEYELSEGMLAMVMERGSRDLYAIIHSPEWSIKSIPFYISQLLDCIQEVHSRGIVHSDLKPSNFVSCDGVLKLIDFGISSSIPDHTAHVYKADSIGTISYMAPETLQDSTRFLVKFGKPSDMWSLGCIIYEMFYGQAPFRKYGNRQLNCIISDVPPDWDPEGLYGMVPAHYIQLMKGLLDRSPATRFTLEAVRTHQRKSIAISSAFLEDLVTYAVDLGGKDEQKRTDERLKMIAGAVFTKLQSLSL